MDHAFASRRSDLRAIDDASRVLDDVTLMLKTMTKADKLWIARRMDVRIAGDALRAAVCAHATRLGALLEEVDGHAGSTLSAAHQIAWERFLAGSADVPAGLSDDVASLRTDLRARRERLASAEGADGGSSTYSDYSASSTDDDSDEEEEGSDRTRTTASTRS